MRQTRSKGQKDPSPVKEKKSSPVAKSSQSNVKKQKSDPNAASKAVKIQEPKQMVRRSQRNLLTQAGDPTSSIPEERASFSPSGTSAKAKLKSITKTSQKTKLLDDKVSEIFSQKSSHKIQKVPSLPSCSSQNQLDQSVQYIGKEKSEKDALSFQDKNSNGVMIRKNDQEFQQVDFVTPSKPTPFDQSMIQEGEIMSQKAERGNAEKENERKPEMRQKMVGCKRALDFGEGQESIQQETKAKRSCGQDQIDANNLSLSPKNKDSILDITASAQGENESQTSRQGQNESFAELDDQEEQEQEQTDNGSQDEEGKPSKNTDSNSYSYDFYAYSNIFFQTEKINLPRGKVVEEDSIHSSPSHGFRRAASPQRIHGAVADYEGDNDQFYSLRPGSLSPGKIDKDYQEKMYSTSGPPDFDDTQDYYREFWRVYLQNENLVADVDQTAHQCYKMNRKIFNIKDFYENTLVPQILTQPHKFLHRLRQQQHQQKLLIEAKERQARIQVLQEQKRALGIVQQNSTVNEDQSCGSPDAKNKRKKHLRRTATEIDRTYMCPYEGCTKFFGSEGSQNLHIKIKHNGGSKTDREKLAKTLIHAYASNTITNEIIDSVDLNLPPGVLTKMAQKAGLMDKVNEMAILDTINRRLAPKFREMIVQQSYKNEKSGSNEEADQDLSVAEI